MLSELIEEIEEKLRLIVREEVRLALLEFRVELSELSPEEGIKENLVVKKDIPSLLRAADVAEILGVSVQRIYELARSRKTNGFPVIKIGERQYRFSKEAILAWVKRDD